MAIAWPLQDCSFSDDRKGHAIVQECGHPNLSSCFSDLSIVSARTQTLLVSKVTQAAQHSRMRVAHESNVAEPFAQWVLLEGEVLEVRGLITCQVIQQSAQCLGCHIIGIDKGGW